MMRRGVVITVFGVLAAWQPITATAQPATFQNPRRFSLSGASPDATGLMLLTDVGSLNGPEDGIVDVIAAGQDQRISLLYGRGDGIFLAGVTSDIGRIPTGLAIAHVNGDNIKDLLITDTAGQLHCFEGFDDGRPYALDGVPANVIRNPVAVEVANLNGDQNIDAVVVSEGDQGSGGVTLLLGNGDCTFSAPAPPADSRVFAGQASSGAAVGDFNRDSRIDIAVVNAVSRDVSILRRDAQGRYSNVQTIPVQEEPIAIETADLNNDDRLDLVVTNRNSDTVNVILARPDGSFGASRPFASGSPGSAPTGLALADVNLDGNIDVVVPNNRSSDASVLLGDGLGSLFPARVFVADQEPLAVAVGLVNADAAPDVVVVSRGNQGPNAAILLGLADGTLAGVEDLTTEPNPNGVALGDFDNDGRPDVLVPHGDGTVLLFNSTAADSFVLQPEIDAAAEVIDVLPGDFDGNGWLDFVTLDNNEARVSYFAARGDGTFKPPVSVTIGGIPVAGVSTDINADGFTDLAIVRQGSGLTDSVDVLLANGSGGFAAPRSFAVGETAVSIDFGDCNNDGRVDLFVANNGSADVTVLIGNGSGMFTAGPPRLLAGAPKAISVGDFDRMGSDDFAVALSMSTMALLYYGNGSCGFAAGSQNLSGGGSPSGIAVRDFSGDGIPDALLGDEVSNTATLFNKVAGGQFFQPGGEIPVSRRPTSVEAADFDGDGRYDAALSNSFVAGSVSILTNIRAPMLLRGDANSDLRVTAADLGAVLREVTDGGSVRIEEAARAGFAAGSGVDANGDGLVTPQDAMGVAARIFEL